MMVSRATLTIVVIPAVISFAFGAWVYSSVLADSSGGKIGNCVEGCQYSNNLANGINSNSPFFPTLQSPPANIQLKDVSFLIQYPPHLVIGQTGTFSVETRSGTPPFTFEWDFGDGTKSSSQVATHAYDKEGTYYVKIVVKDSKDNSGTLSPLKYTVTKAQ